ncbi:MAG TPA: MOSC domain-containing protein [Symbiobacteriaceae bacterium]|nr:MOSC domain-containing protein [Symbiobacteriaceae bacterium]
MKVCVVNVGGPATYEYDGKQVTTAFFKHPVDGPLFLSKTGLPGDAQVDTVHHGGPDKAALLYATEHTPYWTELLGKDPGPAIMGETLTVSGLTEAGAKIGDVYQIGEAVVQVSQPRVPCYKANIRHGIADMDKKVMACGYTGVYVRVLTEGQVKAGDSITLVSRNEGAPTVAELNHLVYHDQGNKAEIARCLANAVGLAEVWQGWLRKLS